MSGELLGWLLSEEPLLLVENHQWEMNTYMYIYLFYSPSSLSLSTVLKVPFSGHA